MNDQKTYETIERYLSGELQGEELREFETRLATEADLREELDLHRGLAQALGDAGTMEFLKALEAAEAEYRGREENTSGSDETSRPGRVRPLWRQGYSVAAAILLLVVVGGFFLLRNLNGEDPGELYKRYFSVYEAPGEWRTEDPVLTAGLKTAFDAYNAKNFDAAMKAFGNIENRDPGNVTARFYLSICAMATGKTDQAIPRLKALADEPGHPYRGQSRWYLALAHLQQGQVHEARPLLETLSSGSGKYATLARELLSRL